MKITDMMNAANSAMNSVNTVLYLDSGEPQLNDAKEGYKEQKRWWCITMIVTTLACFGIMYLRFRIFGA